MWRKKTLIVSVVLLLLPQWLEQSVRSVEIELNGHRFTLPDGFTIELAASSPIVERPICCDFDLQGRLYVAESSGSNDNVKQQLEERPHSILRLVDEDGDGVYDKRTVFADKMMFPEGALWHNGSLYVAAPPQIWKLTDQDDDGVADQREVWFDGKTLTGCANDLHGPYLGRDGWIYWCKGAFAEQTYEHDDQAPLITRAAHIFRRHPDGGPIEPVMTGGMDNPVEVAFTPSGERIFTTTFLQHPGGGRRDGLVHAIYGGVYGKRHGVLDGHARTGELLEPMVHLGAAAPCGLMCREGNQWGGEYRHNLFACSFNMHKVTRHKLEESGATYSTVDHDFLVSDQLDFHPTDVLEDGNGSLLVVDTGGWYKLCCPTSQLWKPDVLGAIYRVRREGIFGAADSWGKEIAWDSLTVDELARKLSDARPQVRRQAQERLRNAQPSESIAAIGRVMTSPSKDARLNAIWTTGSISDSAAREVARRGLDDQDPTVRKAALSLASLWQDKGAVTGVGELLRNGSSHERRLAAETLGRLKNIGSVTNLLRAARENNQDRFLEHSLIFAMIEIADTARTQRGLLDSSPTTRRAALIALDQTPGFRLQVEQVLPLFDAEDDGLRSAALWIAEHQSDWGKQISPYLKRKLFRPKRRDAVVVQQFMVQYAADATVQETMSTVLTGPNSWEPSVNLVLASMADAQLKPTPPLWYEAVTKQLKKTDSPELISQAVVAGLAFSGAEPSDDWFAAFQKVIDRPELDDRIKLQASIVLARNGSAPSDVTFALAKKYINDSQPLELRSLAADLFSKASFDAKQIQEICEVVPNVGPLEIERVIAAFKRSDNSAVGLLAIDNLKECSAANSLPADRIKAAFAHFPKEVGQRAEQWMESVATSKEEQLAGLNDLLAGLPPGDIRRGQQLFHGTKVSCFACHAMGYLGGNSGPDLTRIGRIRSDRDMLEAILYPSASFVRSYEPYQVITVDGQVHVGILREDNALEVVLTNTERKNIRIARSEIDEMQRSQVSIMPAGLDKQLSQQQMADLLEFLRSTR